MKIKFSDLVPNNYNPRKLFRSASLEELKESIRNYGLIEPLVVRSIDNGKFEVVCGMRRYYALKDLEIDDIECTIKDLDDSKAVDLAFMENIHRENLTPIEEAKMYLTRLKMIPEFKDIQNDESGAFQNSQFIKKLSNLYSTGESTIRSRLSILSLPEELQNAIENNNLPLTIAYEISRLYLIEDKDLAIKAMLEIYEDYKLEKDTITLGELNTKISVKIDYYKSKEKEQNEITHQRIKDLKKKIKETEQSKEDILNKLENKIEEIYKNPIFENNELVNIKSENEDRIVKSKTILEFLKIENDKYSTNELYENVVNQLNELENHLSDIRLLISRTKEKNIRVCPFCYAGIDLPTIKKKEDMYKEKLEAFKNQRSKIAGIKGFINDTITEMNKFLNAIEKKNEFLEKFNDELKVLKENV